MPRYISLLRFTDKGAREIKKPTARTSAFDKAAEKAGVHIDAQYWMFGAYDGLLIINAEKEAKALQCLTELVAAGNVRTHTMPCFAARQFGEVHGGSTSRMAAG